MHEPPILPEDSRGELSSDDPALGPEKLENPYAPTAEGPALEVSQALYLPMAYWTLLLLAFIGLTSLSFPAPGLGIPALLALVSAAVRVPLLQRRLASIPASQPAHPIGMLLTSWVFSLLIGAASLVAFCVICVPAGFLALSVNGQGFGISMVAGISGLCALGVYVFLFRLSLKMQA